MTALVTAWSGDGRVVSRGLEIATSIVYRRNTMNAADRNKLASLCKALGHPARIRILEMLLKKGTCHCGELVAGMSQAQSTVSQHLKMLKDAALIVGEIDGPRRCYCVDPARLELLERLLLCTPANVEIVAECESSLWQIRLEIERPVGRSLGQGEPGLCVIEVALVQ